MRNVRLVYTEEAREVMDNTLLYVLSKFKDGASLAHIMAVLYYAHQSHLNRVALPLDDGVWVGLEVPTHTYDMETLTYVAKQVKCASIEDWGKSEHEYAISKIVPKVIETDDAKYVRFKLSDDAVVDMECISQSRVDEIDKAYDKVREMTVRQVYETLASEKIMLEAADYRDKTGDVMVLHDKNIAMSSMDYKKAIGKMIIEHRENFYFFV